MSWKDSYDTRINFNGVNSEDRLLAQGIKDFKVYLKDAPNKKTITIGYTDYTCVLQDVMFNDSNKDNKILLVELDTPLRMGVFFELEEENWIVTGIEKNSIGTHNTFKIQQCTNNLLFNKTPILLPENLVSVPCIVSNKVSLSTDETKFMTLPEKVVSVAVQNNVDTLTITEGQRFLIGRNAYKVEGVDDISSPGLLIIRMSGCAKQDGDDFSTGIAVQNPMPTSTTPLQRLTTSPTETTTKKKLL